jgi:hypothetical protein
MECEPPDALIVQRAYRPRATTPVPRSFLRSLIRGQNRINQGHERKESSFRYVVTVLADLNVTRPSTK